jgi:long-subunit fatty acid transport protein
MLGASLGIQSIQYTESSVYTEYNTYGLTPAYNTDLDYYNYHTYLHQSGTGFNFKFGIIGRPLPFLRLGAAIHTPSYYNIWEHYNSDITAVYLDDSIYVANSPYGEFNYKYRTPFKATGSVALILGKYMILSFDYEYQGYKSTEFSPLQYSDDYLRILNQQIDEKFKNTNNFRAGLEFKLTPSIGLRGGFLTQDSPYKKEYQDNKSRFYTYSGGIGYRTMKYFIDAAYILTTSEYDYYNYNWNPEDGNYYGYEDPVPARIKTKDNRVIVTLGFRF